MLSTSTDVTVTTVTQSASVSKGSAVAILVNEKGEVLAEGKQISDAWRKAGEQAMKEGTLAGKLGEAATLFADGQRLIVVGAGQGQADHLRQAAATVAKQARRFKAKEVALIGPADAGEALACGFCVGAFEYREYRGSAAKQKEADALGKVKLSLVGGDKSAAARGEAIAFGQNYARTIANRPGNDINPVSLAKEARKLAREMNLTCKVLDEKQAAKLGMGGLLAVGSGSGTPPRMIVLEHGMGGRGSRGSKTKSGKPLLVVGKAITFDTGGISIKPAANMGSMVFDKCGGMAVLGLMAAVAKMKLKRPVVGLLAAAENMPGPTAYRPGDILRMYNGVTVEVTNTDAEGRLVLADALAWGIETYKPAACVNLATLTGACVVALGNSRAGAWSNDDGLWNALSAASQRAGEKFWRMPLGDDYREMLKASVAADIVNSPGRWGGCDTAAEFLHHFIPGNLDGAQEVPWCHLDIAGVADAEKETPLYVKGATGFAVRTLVEWVTVYAE